MVISGPTLNVVYGAKSSSVSPLGASTPISFGYTTADICCGNFSTSQHHHSNTDDLLTTGCTQHAIMPIAEMSRESRHVHVLGLPDALSEERVSNFFSTFGRVQKAERLSSSGVVVSFMDVRSAQKAHSAEPKFDGHQLRITFHDQSKNGIVSSSVPSGGVVSPQTSKPTVSGAASGDSHRRSSELHSPGSSSSKHKERSSQHRVASSSSRRASRERCTSSRGEERSQRSRTSINADRRNGGESRNSRRSRRSPRSSDSSESSRDSPSPSGTSSHHHHSSNAPTVPSTVIKLNTSSSRRMEVLESSGTPHDSTSVSLSATCTQSPMQGMQGIYVSNLPSSRSESSLREFLSNAFKKFGKIVHIGFEMEFAPNFVEQRKALIIFQRLVEVDRLLNDVHHLLGLRLKIKLASHMVVTEAYNNLLMLTSAQASAISGTNLSTSHDTPSTYSRSFIKDCSQEGSSTSLHCSPCVDALAPRASRTLYVGGLERRTSDDSLRSRFAHFGHILDIDVKNWESPSPFAFIQFADVQSVVRAINAYNGNSSSSHTCGNKAKFKTNWGRTIVTNKIWIGELPSSCSPDYLREKIRVSFTETFNEVIYDPRWNEALLLFANNESAQRAFTMIKTKQIAFWDGDEKRDVHVPVDYCSEKLHDYFVDRKFRGDKESAASDLNGTSSFGTSSATSAVAPTSSLLAPPPDPPSHLRDIPRLEYRRSGSNGVPKRRRSIERDPVRNSSRSSRYSCAYNRSRRRRGRARHDDDQSASTSTSSSSTSESDSSGSRTTSPERKRDNTTNRSRSSQRSTNHPSASHKPREQSTSSSSARRGSSTPTMRVEPSGTSATSGTGSQLVQLLPPPMPSAAILNPLAAVCDKSHADEAADSKEKRTTLKRQHSFSGSSVDMEADDGEHRKESTCDAATVDNRNSRDSGFCESSHDNASTSETHVITSNRIEEIANTLVNVLQHHSKASTSAVPIDAAAHSATLRSSALHTSGASQPRASEESKSATASYQNQNAAPLGAQKRARWPWGNEPIKSHYAIPLDAYAGSSPKDPRRRPSLGRSSPSVMNLPLPKFAHDVNLTSADSRRNSLSTDAGRTTQQNTETRRPSRGNVNGHSSGCTPPHSSAAVRTHPSVSRSASSGSEAMLSPDATTSSTQHAVIPMSGVDIFGEGSPSSDSNAALRERIFALGAKFQHVDETFQKTKRTTQFDCERKPSTQRPYRFEEELERLRAKSSTGCSPSAPVSSLTASSTVLPSSASVFTDTFAKTRSYSLPYASSDPVDDTAQSGVSSKPLMSVTISLTGQTSVTTFSASTVQTPISASVTPVSTTVSPPFAPGPLKKPPVPPSPAVLKQQTSLVTTQMPPHVVAFPPNFSVPPPPIPQPPAPPMLLSPPALSSSTLISAPPPPPPMMLNSSVLHRDSTTPSTQTTPLLASSAKSAAVPTVSTSSVSASFPSTPVWKSPTVSAPKPGTPHSLSSSSLPSETLPKSTITTTKTPLNRTVDKTTNREIFQRSCSLASASKHSHSDRLRHNDPGSKSLNDLFRQQAQDSSEMRKKQMLKTKTDEGNEPKQERDKDNDSSKKVSNETVVERNVVKEADKKEKVVRDIKEKKKGWDGSEGKMKTDVHHSKEISEKKEKEKERESKAKDMSKEKRSIKEDREKERSKAKEKAKEKATKAKKEEERKRREQKEKERKRKEKTKEKRRRKAAKDSDDESDSEESESSSSDEQINIHSFDIEMQRLMLEEAASGSLGLSMYDRVKRRSSAMKPDDTAKKNKTLEILREKTQNKRNNQRRVKRVRLESSSEDNDEDNQRADEDSDAVSSISSGAVQRSSKNTKVASTSRCRKAKTSKANRKQARSEDSESDEDAHDGREKTSAESDSDEEVVESRRRKRKPAASKKSVKRTQAKLKAHSLSLDDVFGAYSTDDESTQQSRGSLAPSVDSKNDKREKAKEKKEKEREGEKGKEKEATEKEKEEGEKEKERMEKPREKERDRAKEKEKEEKDKEGEMERSEEVEKEKEKKFESRKRPKKTLSTVELFGRDSDVDMPSEKKKQKVEKSLVEISMFPEVNKKELKQKKKEGSRKTSEVKKTKEGEKTQVSKTEQFEKKLAKRLRKEQKEREEEQKREADESKKKKEENRIEKDIEKASGQTTKDKEVAKTGKGNREEEEDNIQKMEIGAETQHDENEPIKTEIPSEEMPQDEVVEEAAVKEEYERACEGIHEKQLEEGVKQDDEHKTNENIVDLGEKPPLEDEGNERERKRKADENEGVFDVKRIKEETKEEMPRKQLSDSDSSAGETKQKNTRRQKTTKRRATRKRVKNEEMETISEPRSDSSMTAAVKSELSEESECLLTPSDTMVKPCVVDEPASEKYGLLEDASKWGAESAKSVTDDDGSVSVSARTLSKDAMKAPPEVNIVATQSPHVTTETEDAVQSIALFDDNASRHSGEEGSAAMDINYMSDATSRRSSIADTATVLAQDPQDVQKEFANGTTEDQEEKDVDADAEVQQEMETKVDEESNNDDEKLVDSVTHIDEVIDDVVAGGYMEVDAEQLMLINSKAKEEADRAAALASQQNTPQTPHSTHSFQGDSGQTTASTRSVEHQHQMNVPSNSICMMQSQMMQQQPQTQQIQQQQQQSQMQQQPHSQQSQTAIASPYHQMQQPLSMQHTQSRHEIIHQQTVPVNAPAEMHQAIGVRVQQQTMQQQQQPVQQSALQQQHQPLQQQQQQSMQQPQQQPSVQQIHQKVVQSQQPLQQPPTQQQMMQQHPSLQSPTMQHLMQRQTMHQQQQAHQMAVHVQPQQQQMHQLQQQKLFTEQPPIEQPVQASASVALQQQTEVQRTNAVGYACASDYFTNATGAQQSDSMQSPHASRGMQSSMGTQQHQLGYGAVGYACASDYFTNATGAQQSDSMQSPHASRGMQSSMGTQQHQLGYGNLPAATAAPNAHMQMQAAVSTCQRLNQPTSAYDIYRQPPSVKQQQPPIAHQHQSQQQQQPADVSRQSVSHISGTSTSPSMLSHLPGTSSSIPQLNASVSLQQQQANSAAYRRQQPSPMQQAAIAASAALSPFAMALPATSSSTYFQTAQMQEQYMQMCRNTLLQQGGAASTAQPPQDTAAQVMRNYAHIFQAATNAYGSGMSGTYGAPPHAAYPTSASLVNGGTSSNASPLTTGMQQERARQQQTQQVGLNHGTQTQSCAVSVQQQNQQANIAAVAQQQLNSLYSNGSLTFGYGTPTVQQHTARQGQQVTQQNIPLGGVPQRQQQVKVANTASKKQQIKTFQQPPSVASSSRYPVLWQGIVALKTNEARIQMHRVGGNIEMLKRSLVQLATMSNNMPVIRINQRMRMEASQLESVQSKMTDEQSYIALICLSCGFNKDDIRNQSEMLKERFVDYLESKQAAGICNVGNEQHPSPNSIVHVFPPCEFATTFLQRNSPDLFETIRQQRANYLFVVITSAS
uniref:Msx2-interacting protein n=1 Tax=Parascaris univalens TaxID=6257 RepID=A0A915BDJ7_PARUN